MNINCSQCNKPIAKIDRRRKSGERIAPTVNATLTVPPRQALKAQCQCGHTTAVIRYGEIK